VGAGPSAQLLGASGVGCLGKARHGGRRGGREWRHHMAAARWAARAARSAAKATRQAALATAAKTKTRGVKPVTPLGRVDD
jgi:hypothetical protein